MTPPPPPAEIWHATCVAVGGLGVLILGPSGAGKSAMALEMMAMGARLVADDRVLLTRHGEEVVATCPPATRGLIEARGVGLLRADPLDRARVVLAVDLGQAEAERLPPPRNIPCLGVSVDLVLGGVNRHVSVAVLQYLRAGRHA